MLYSDPTSEDVWLAPAYDLVNTTAYLPDDSLALTLGGSKSLFASRVHLLEFGKRCSVADARGRILELLGAVEQELKEQIALLESEPQVRRGLQLAFEGFAGRF